MAAKLVHDIFDRKYQAEYEAEVSGEEQLAEQQGSKNLFDQISSLAPPKKTALCDELESYLNTDIKVDRQGI
ncbi:hypothetical protein C0992_008010 [Termitomyces sp. T32_za158]|nr:hypothetical protein C0992_008010 [Termitomyces sp. T32_za158]